MLSRKRLKDLEDDILSSSDLDPSYRYIAGAHKRMLLAHGVEWAAYRIFGPEFIGSLAFAIDPLKSFRYNKQQPVPANRSRKFTARGTPNSTKVRTIKRTIVGSQPPDTTTSGDLFDRLAYSETVSSTTTTGTASNQVLINGTIDDTTVRTRPLGQEYGEFELWNPQIFAKGASRLSLDDQNSWQFSGPYQYRERLAGVEESFHIGPCARVSKLSVDSVKTSMRNNLLNAMASDTVSMVSDVTPYKREFALAYSVAELKDLPRSIKGIYQTLLDARRSAPNKAAREFLSYEFGWRQIYKDTLRLARLPERISKKINFLLRRNRKLTTLRVTRTLEPFVVSPAPSFIHTLLSGESQKSLATEAYCSRELRLAVNVLIDFPEVAVPKLRDSFEFHNYGVLPTPEDFYNLVPWSWLTDWFTGLGEYVSLYDRINLDPQLVNVGFVTGVSTLVAKSVLTTERQTVDKRAILPPIPAVWYSNLRSNSQTREARLHAKLQIRKSLVNAYGLTPSWELTALSDFQLSILGALFAVKTL